MKIAFICTGNTARSQIAEALAKYFSKKYKKDIKIFSAGSKPAGYINPYALKVLEETGLDVSDQYSKGLEDIPLNEIDIFITLCDDAKENCPYIPKANYIHYGLPDPAKVEGTEQEILNAFRQTRDNLYKFLDEFIREI